MNHPEFEITLDTKEDYQFIKEIYETLYPQNEDFSAEDVVNLLIERPKMTNILRNNYRKDPFKEQKEWEENHGQKV